MDGHVDGLCDLRGHCRVVGERGEGVPRGAQVVGERLMVEEDPAGDDGEAGQHIGVHLAEQLVAIQRGA